MASRARRVVNSLRPVSRMEAVLLSCCLMLFAGAVLEASGFGREPSNYKNSSKHKQQPNEPKKDPPEEDLLLTFRLLPNAKPETLELIAKITQPDKIPVKKGDDISEILKRKYGFSNKTLWRIFKSVNPSVNSAQAQDDMELLLPGGPRWSFNVQIEVSDDITVKEQVAIQMGTSGSDTKAQVESKNKEIIGKWEQTIESEDPSDNTDLLLPYVTRPVSYIVRPEYKSDIQSLVERLKLDKAVVLIDVTPVARLRLQSIVSQDTCRDRDCKDISTESGWQMGATSLDKVQEGAFRNHNQIVIAVVDAGISQNGVFDGYLWQNLKELGRVTGVDEDKNLYTDDINGVNFVDPNYALFPLDDVIAPELQSHGTHVAGLCCGRLINGPLSSELKDRIHLMILKVVRESGTVDLGAVASAIIYVQEKSETRIVNMSLDIIKFVPLIRDIERLSHVLFIAAAGNGENTGNGKRGCDISRRDVYPAVLTSKLNNVISVAAHDPNDQLTCFSNFSAINVDIAAPGIDIESTSVEGTSLKLSGTSQATPFVSLTAALILSQEPSLPPLEVKNRILSTVDFVPSLEGKVSSSGKLNIAKAVSLYDDIIELKDKSQPLLRGKIICPKFISIEGEEELTPIGAIRKIVFDYSNTPDKTHRVTLDSENGRLRHLLRHLDLPDIVIELKEGGRRVISPGDIKDFMPALVRPPTQDVDCSTN